MAAEEQGQEQARKAIAVIDGNSLMHRAFHAIPPTMTAPDGRPTGALFGFISMFMKMLEDLRPYGVICAFDKGKPTRRLELSSDYKAQRPPTDPVLKAQFPMIRELMGALSVPVKEVEGWEGDDILGTLARQGEEAGYDMLLVTGDRDAYQLVTEHVCVVATKKGLSDVVVYSPAAVEELYDGVTPAQIPDFYGLKGDTSDNIPGVPGVGPKKASALICQYGSLDEVLAHADEIKGKMGENVRTHADDALLSRRLATIETQAPVTFDADEARWPQFDADVVKKAFGELGFTTLTRRVLAALSPAAGTSSAAGADTEGEGAEGAGAPVAAGPALPEAPLQGEEAWEALRAAVEAGAWVATLIDDGAAQDTLFSVDQQLYVALSAGWQPDLDALAHAVESAAPGPVPACTGAAAAEPARIALFGGDDVARALELIYTHGCAVSFDTKADLRFLVPSDSSELAAVRAGDLEPARMCDVGVAAYLLDSNRSSYAPTDLVSAYLAYELPQAPAADKRSAKAKQPVDAAFRTRLCMCTAASALVLREVLLALLDADGSRACLDDIEMPLVPALVWLERAGMGVSIARLHELSGELGHDIDDIRARVIAQAGEEFNLDSPRQLSHVLFDTLGLPTKGNKRSKSTGAYSTNAKILDELAGDFPVVADVLEYREKAKIKSTYLDALPQQVAGDGRIHTTYNQKVTATGRLSSSDPNLQNIPVRTDLGRMVRAAFVPEDPAAWCILGCDYSQIELRLLAHLSEDEGLIAAFTEGEDFHAETAARVFGVESAQVTPQMRSRAKAVNFGIVYGQGAYGLSTSLGIGFGEAQEMIDRYFIQFPQVRAYLDGLKAFAHEHGWVETMFGRKRHVPDVFSPVANIRAFGERTAMNHPMQGSAADIIKIAMTRVQNRLAAGDLRAKMIVQVHDELDFECPLDEVEKLSALVTSEMAHVVELRVPLVVSCATGPSWAEAH